MQQQQEKVLYSPKENVSEQHIVLLQDAITRIKELVIKGGSQLQIQTIINEYANKFVDKATQQAIRRSLTNSANKMMYQYNYNNNVIQQAFIQKTVKALRLGTGTNLSNKTYTTDLNSIYNEYLTGNISQHKCVEEFRNTLNNAKKGLFLMRDYDNLVRQQVDLLASEPAKYVDKNGNAISLRNKVEMSVRYQANLADVANMKNEGVKLVWISSHADASPRCRDHQGKLYSLDDTSGTIDGISYTPLADVLRKNGGNSIINGYNCRHYLIEYKKGSTSPSTYNKQQIQREYKIDQKQRQYENNIRHLKTQEALLRANSQTKEASIIRKRWQKLNKQYETYSRNNGRAFYRWRTQISESEKEYILDNTKPIITPKSQLLIFEESIKLEPVTIKGELGQNKTIKNTFSYAYVSKTNNEVNELYKQLSNIKDIKVSLGKKSAHLQGNKIMLADPSFETGRRTNIHELGHLINQQAQENIFYGTSLSQKSVKLAEAVSSEYTELDNVIKVLEKNNLLETNKKIKNINAQEIVQTKYEELAKEELKIFKGTKIDWLKKQPKLIDKAKEHYKTVMKELTNNEDDQNNATLYDMVDGMTRGKAYSYGKLYTGHGEFYYNDISLVQEELFANFLSLHLGNATQQLQVFKELYPKTYDELTSLVSEANKILKRKYT